jgi:hypothetical protein
MKRQERRGAEGDGDLSDACGTEEERPESAEQPVGPPQVRRSMARTAKDDQLVLEQEILRDDRSHAAGTTQLRDHDGEVKQGEQEIFTRETAYSGAEFRATLHRR